MDRDNPTMLSRRAFLRLALLASVPAALPVPKTREKDRSPSFPIAKKDAQVFLIDSITKLRNALSPLVGDPRFNISQSALVAGTVAAIGTPSEKKFRIFNFQPSANSLTFIPPPERVTSLNAIRELNFTPSKSHLKFIPPQPRIKQNEVAGISRRKLLQIAYGASKAVGITTVFGGIDHFLFGGNLLIKPVERALKLTGGIFLSQFRKISVTPVAYDHKKIFTDEPKSSQSSSSSESNNPPSAEITLVSPPPTAEITLVSPPPTAFQEKPAPIDNKEQAQKEIGDENFAEFFLGDLVDMFKQKRLRKAGTDPSYRERVDPEYLKSDRINFVYLGIDQTRERFNDFDRIGLGRSDVIMFVSFDPHTFKTMAISIPRDLFCPEVREGIADYYNQRPGNLPLAKINEMTMMPLYNGDIDSNELARKILETATGMPVDGVIKTDIDFMQGSEGIPGVFDDLFPEGLEITVPKAIVDPEYPVGYGTKVLVFEPGKQTMNGRRLTEYGRTRHADSDFARSERQRQILSASMKILLPHFVEDIAKGEVATFDKVIDSLQKQKNNADLFFDVNIIEIITTIRNKFKELQSSPKGMAVLGVLAANTTDEIADLLDNKKASFVSYGLSRENGMAVDTQKSQPNYAPYQLHLFPSSTELTPSPLGNHYKYWMPLRLMVNKFLKE